MVMLDKSEEDKSIFFCFVFHQVSYFGSYLFSFIQ